MVYTEVCECSSVHHAAKTTALSLTAERLRQIWLPNMQAENRTDINVTSGRYSGNFKVCEGEAFKFVRLGFLASPIGRQLGGVCTQYSEVLELKIGRAHV